MVAPSTVTVDCPPACGRRTVGSLTSTDTMPSLPGPPGATGRWTTARISTSPVDILPGLDDHRLLLDDVTADPVGPHGRIRVPERDEHVMPARVRGLGDVGGRRIGIGVRMGVEDADDLDAPGLGVAVGPEVLPGVDGVELRRGGHVPGQVAALHVPRGGVTAEQPARL